MNQESQNDTERSPSGHLANGTKLPSSHHWSVKVILTVLIGGALSASSYLLLPRLIPIGLSRDPILHVSLAIFWYVAVASFLYSKDGSISRTALKRGLVIGLISMAVSAIIGILFLIGLMSTIKLH